MDIKEEDSRELKDHPRAQQERLAHIDFMLYFLGELRRQDVAERFGMGPSGVTRDIALYRRFAPGNCEMDPAEKVYRPTPNFQPLFKHSARRVLTALSEGFGEGLGEDWEAMLPSDTPLPLTLPDVAVLAPISRAINRKLAVKLHYTSVKSGKTEKTLVPIALIDTGIRWHVRAYDRDHEEFRDYVLNRMENPVALENSPAGKGEMANDDEQWSRVISLALVPHPSHPRPGLVCMDYGMRDDVLKIKVRAANAGYMLRRWSVDCSPDHHLNGIEYALWLPDSFALYGANNAQLAPGYKDPRELAKSIQAL
ncbi:MAG TPA: WYL domain-containing protein [Polaromonas sp.]|uniref:helix-turn-helix transcriptional regulator n=1 Tax=Polaromonas sp. TaxID=1869339 RepID=UPI002D71943A|nr:WYL domain-containing protein [Polaromonas sp.]HYW55762.1 WYL domain-containing protein [Polaromonas sp.]